MSIAYACEKIYSAVRSLIADNRSLRDRLEGAVVNSLYMIQADRDLPEDLRADFNSLMAKFTEHGTIAVSISVMDDHDVYESADKIVSLLGKVEGAYHLSAYPTNNYND